MEGRPAGPCPVWIRWANSDRPADQCDNCTDVEHLRAWSREIEAEAA